MAKEIKIKKAKNTKLKVKANPLTKSHNVGKVNSKKASKPGNMPSNYGVK
jgi:hypothetical protein